MTHHPTNIDEYFEGIFKLSHVITAQDNKGEIFSLNNAAKLAINLIRSASYSDGKIIFIGNGGSAAIASHMAVDFSKNGDMPAICFNDGAFLTCLANDLGYEQVFSQSISLFAKPNDILIAISSSGQSENIINGVKVAGNIPMNVITLSGFDERNPLKRMGDINFHVPYSRYGMVEISHLTLCHAFLDLILGEKAM